MIRNGLLITLESAEEEQELIDAVNEHMKNISDDTEDFLDNELNRIYLMYAFPNIGDLA